MSKKLTFQEIILTLQQYWNDQGCMLMQAYDNEKGAGTMSPLIYIIFLGLFIKQPRKSWILKNMTFGNSL